MLPLFVFALSRTLRSRWSNMTIRWGALWAVLSIVEPRFLGKGYSSKQRADLGVAALMRVPRMGGNALGLNVPVSSIGEDEEGNVYITGYQDGVISMIIER